MNSLMSVVYIHVKAEIRDIQFLFINTPKKKHSNNQYLPGSKHSPGHKVWLSTKTIPPCTECKKVSPSLIGLRLPQNTSEYENSKLFLCLSDWTSQIEPDIICSGHWVPSKPTQTEPHGVDLLWEKKATVSLSPYADDVKVFMTGHNKISTQKWALYEPASVV